MASSEEIAWAAGIYEGEGYILSYGPNPRITVTQKDPWLLERLKYLFGGSIDYGVDKRNGCSTWRMSGPKARKFAETIYPLLSPRRQAQINKQLEVH